ncbi:MAG: DUF1735 domain-containing protein [Bacteroidota bacterium]
MKITNIKLLIGAIAVSVLTSCENGPIPIESFDYTATYFGWQYPVRTLVLGGSDYYDTTNDLLHQFEIKASMSGVSANVKNINVQFEIDPSLVDSLAFNNGTSNVRLKLLPSTYYEPITMNNMVIPAGSFNGGITVKLTDAFFADPLSYTTKYVLPIRILSTTTDSLLKGRKSSTSIISPISTIASKWGVDPRIPVNWEVKAQNYTIYAIKYVNKYNGYYLKRGVEQDITTGVTATAKGYGWEKKFIEYTTFIPKLSTLSLTKLLYSDKLAVSSVNFKGIMEVAADNTVTIIKEPTSTTNISGTGKYVVGLEQWGGKQRNAFYLNYTVTDPATSKTYSVKDTLVIRDNAVAVETFTPVILQ